MFWKVFYFVAVLSQCSCGFEIEEHDWEVPSSEYEEILVTEEPVHQASEKDHEKLVKSDEHIADDEDEAAPSVSFTGPVTAKGKVSVAATFGYDSSISYPAPSSTGQPWFPPAFVPQYFFPASPLFAAPTPFTFSNIPLVSMFLPGIGITSYPENTLENLPEIVDKKPKEIFLNITPMKGKETPVVSDSANPSVESLSPEEILENPVVFLEENFPDYGALEEERGTPVTGDIEESEKPADGLVFGGFVPASGSIKIAARF